MMSENVEVLGRKKATAALRHDVHQRRRAGRTALKLRSSAAIKLAGPRLFRRGAEL